MTSLRLGRRRATGALATLALTGALGLAVPSIASAHTALVSMSPADGSLLTTAPTSIVLTFDQNIQDVGDGIVVRDPNGTNVEEGKPVVLNNTVTEQLKPITIPGHYTVDYRVTSADGHPVSKQLGFDYLERGASAPAAATSSTEVGSGVMVGIAIAVGALVVLALLAWLILRRRGSGAE